MEKLTQKKCVPCEGGIAPLKPAEFSKFLEQTPGWKVINDMKITRDFAFKNFKEAMAFVNAAGELAETEGHHPNLEIHEYKYVRVTNYTHAIGGLHQNDFILAAKIDELSRD